MRFQSTNGCLDRPARAAARPSCQVAEDQARLNKQNPNQSPVSNRALCSRHGEAVRTIRCARGRRARGNDNGAFERQEIVMVVVDLVKVSRSHLGRGHSKRSGKSNRFYA